MSYHTAKNPSELRSAIRWSIRRALRRTSTALISLPGLALAGPEGGDVIRGAADIINPDPNTTTINQHTDRAVINWQTFNVDADEYVIFNQLDSSSVVLNRVLSSDASYILGQMQANGQVFLLNPHGMFFGEGAVLDVQGFLGTTLDIANDEFMAGNYNFTRADNAAALGQVANAGTITAGDGGYVMLAGDFTENTGLISAMGGTAALVSGNALTLDIVGDGLVNFAVDEATLAEQAGVRNAGSIIADGGMVVMTARVAHDVTSTVVNNEGTVRARSIENRGGEIWLVGHGGDVEQSGTLDANGANADGGRVILYGDNDIVLADGGVQTATGDDNHSGGTIRAIAEDHLDFQAGNTMQATGDVSGGFVEVSGHGSIALRGMVDVGRGGTYLIDPSAINIVAGSATGSVGTIGVNLITDQLDIGVNVVVAASSQITAAVPSLNASGSGDLTLGIGNMSGGTGGSCIGLGSSLCFGPNPTFTPIAGGSINVSGMNINIAGNIDIIAQDGNVTVGDVETTGGSINIEAASVTANSLDATGSIDIDAIGTFSGGTITINGLGVAAGNNVRMIASNASYGGRINIAGGMSAGGLASLNAVTGFGSGGSINIGNGILADRVSLHAEGGTGRIRLENFSGVAIQANNNVSLTALGTGTGSFASGGRIEIGTGAIGDSFVGHEVISSNGNITLNATDINQNGGGKIFAGSLTAGGDISITADGGGFDGGQIFIGDDGFPQPVKDITAGGAVTLTANGENQAQIDVRHISGASIRIEADAIHRVENGTASINAGNLATTSGNLALFATGYSSGDANIFTGTLNAEGGNVHVEATGGETAGGTATLNVNGEVKADGHIDLYAGAVLADTINVNGGITAGEYIYVWNRTDGNIGINGSVSGGDSIRIHAEGVSSNQGMVGVAGNITGASVDIRAGGGEIGIGTGTRGSAFNGGDVTATTGNLSLALTGNTRFSGGGIIFAGDLLATNGNVNVSAATGEGRIELGNSSGGAMTTRASVSAGNNIDMNASGSLAQIDVGAQSAGNSITLAAINSVGSATITMEGNATANGGNFFAAANGSTARTINIGGNIAAGNNIGFGTGNLLAFGGASHLVSAGNDITIDNQFTTNAVNVDYVAGGNISITAPEVFTGNLTADGRVDLFGNGATFHSIGDVTAQHINAHFLPSGSGSLSLTMGNLLATGTVSGNRDVVVAIDGGSGASTATVNIASATAQDGDVSLTVFDGATGTPTGNLSITNGIDAGALVRLYAPDSITANTISANGNVEIEAGSTADLNSILADGDVRITTAGGIVGSDLIIGSADRFAGTVTLDSPILVTNSLQVWSNELRGPDIGNIGSASNVINTVSLNTSLITAGDVNIYAGNITGSSLGIGTESLAVGNVTINSNIDVSGDVAMWVGSAGNATVTINGQANAGNIFVNATNNLNLSGSAFDATGGIGLTAGGDVNVTGNLTGSSLAIGAETLAVGNVTLNNSVDVSGDVAMWVGAAGNATVAIGGQVNAGDIFITTANSMDLSGNALAATGAIGLDAGNGMNISGTMLLAADVNAVTGTTLNANSAVIAADTVMLDAGTNMSVSNISLDAGQAALVAGGSITNSSPPGTIAADALAVLAGNSIDLGNTQLVIGSGQIASVPGDELFLQLLGGQGIEVPTGGPNLVMRAQNITLGGGTLAGDYVYLETNNLAVNGEFIPNDPNLLLQIAPTGLGASFSLEQSTPGSSDANYVYSGALERFNAGTIALGSTNHTGNVTISNNSTNVDIDATNLFVLTNGTTTGLGKVLSTGIVKDLQDLLSGGFDVPQSDEIDITKDTFTSLDDQYGIESGGGDDEEGDEEGEDTADDGVEEEEDDSLIRRETAEEELMCE